VQRIIEIVGSKVPSGAGARLVIGGPGGVGKTSVALAIFHSRELDGFFAPTRRFFIPCQSVTTASTFLSILASSLDVKISQGDGLALVIEKLKADNTPLMLVLDNAESFWFDYEIQPHASTILRHICNIPSVTLLLTIRGTERPNVTAWDPLPLIGPLSLTHARQAFLAIATDVEPDASLDRLLQMVDCMPLAVSLLARRCQITGESAVTLCNRWEKEHTELLKLGGGEPDNNIDISIKLSLNSPLMRGNDNALRLLSVVSYLPAGVSDEAWSSMPLPEVESSAAEFTLRRLSLTYSPAPGWITTLEPIRVYMRRQHSPRADDLNAVEDWHVNLANIHGNHEPGDPEFPIASGKLTANSANIAFILHGHIQRHNGLRAIADAVLAFSNFLYWTRPNGDLLEMLLSAGTNDLDLHTKGKCLQSLGNILRMQDQYEEAQSKLEEARSEFTEVGNRLGAAQCLQSLGDILQMQDQYEEARSKLEEARSEFTEVGDRLGAAQCLQSLGNILRMQSQYEEAWSKLEEARSKFSEVGDRLGAAQCLKSLGNILKMQE
jgi:tetratricopeptide (TPR) repeat protein